MRTLLLILPVKGHILRTWGTGVKNWLNFAHILYGWPIMAQGSNITLPQTLSLDTSPKNINFLEDAMRGSIQEKWLMMSFKGEYLPHSSGHFDFTR